MFRKIFQFAAFYADSRTMLCDVPLVGKCGQILLDKSTSGHTQVDTHPFQPHTNIKYVN